MLFCFLVRHQHSFKDLCQPFNAGTLATRELPLVHRVQQVRLWSWNREHEIANLRVAFLLREAVPHTLRNVVINIFQTEMCWKGYFVARNPTVWRTWGRWCACIDVELTKSCQAYHWTLFNIQRSAYVQEYALCGCVGASRHVAWMVKAMRMQI